MSIPDLERSLSILNSWRLALGVLTAIAGVLLAMIQIQYARTDSQLSAERTAANLRQRERIATIERDTARALALLAWRRLNEHQFKIVSSGLREERIDRLQIAGLAGDPEAQQFAADLLAAAREAGYDIPRLGQIVVGPGGAFVGVRVSGPAEYVRRLVDLFAAAGFPDVQRQDTGPGPSTISVGAKPPPRSN